MANFSVEWLSRSFYEEMPVQEEVKLQNEVEDFAKESRSQCAPTSPNNSYGYTSESESEEKATQQRRMRTKFTTEQIRKLEDTFTKHRYLGAPQRRKISDRLKLSESQVKTWFQNRRMKLKREAQDMRSHFLTVPTALLPPVLFQHPLLTRQLPTRFSPLQVTAPPLSFTPTQEVRLRGPACFTATPMVNPAKCLSSLIWIRE